ncbi:MAG: portal protein [Allosphingosinicella sp.]
MDDNELAALLAAQEARAVGFLGSEIADEQARAIDYYYGRMDDLPVLDGCSSVVDHSVAVMVDNALAAVLKPFVSAERLVSFEPRGPEDVAQAEQATEYVNYVVTCDNPGFLIFHDWFKDALLTKIGVVKAWWEDESRAVERVVLLDAAELEATRRSPDYLGEEAQADGSFAVRLQTVVPDGRVRIENVPPEEFLITPLARSIESADYVAHRPSGYTRSDLVELGFEAGLVAGLPAFAPGRAEESRSQARYRDEAWREHGAGGAGADRSRDVIGIIDEYVRVDHDGDGVAELRRVIRVADTILFNEPVEEIPFALLCPCPMPHKVYGRALADQAVEGQRVATAVLRQTLDNLYKTNNPRPVIGEGAVGDSTMDDLGDSAPGAVIRVRNPGQMDWAIVPFTAQHSFPMLEYIARGTEERTGIQRKGQGFNAEALRKNSPDTATQAAIDENSRNERAGMIARIFAETGVKRLFGLVLDLLVRHQPRERVIRLRNSWVPMDPRGWSAEMDVSMTVGLGVGSKAEQIGQAETVLAAMERLAATPFGWLVRPDHVHKAVARLLEAAGIRNVDDYLGDPRQAPPTTPDPVRAQAEAETRLKAAELAGRQQDAAARLQLAREESAARVRLMRDEAEAKIMAAREKAALEMQLAREKMTMEIALERERDAAHAGGGEQIRGTRPGGDLDK